MQAAPVLGLGEFFGEPVRRRQILGFAIVENRFAASRTIPPHRHALSHLTCILAGGFVETYPDRSLEPSKGTVLVVPQGRVHEDAIGPVGAHTLSIEIGPKTLARLEETASILREPQVVAGPEIERAVERLYGEFRSRDDASLLAIAALTLELLAAAQRRDRVDESSGRNWMDDVLAELHRDPRSGASLGELASRFGVHESHLARTFRRRNGCSIGEYVRWLRLEGAKAALAESNSTLAEVALEAGFFDQAHFSRAFRKAYGLAPSAYRKSLR